MMQGPGIFLAQFAADDAPFDSFDGLCGWAAECGYVGVQVPSWDTRCLDLAKAAESKDYCDELRGVAAGHGIAISELSSHLQGQLVAVHPAFAEMFAGFAPEGVTTPDAMRVWGSEQVRLCLRASRNLGLDVMPTFSGALMWHTAYPWPQRPPGLVDAAFAELAARWRPLLDAAEECGVDCAYEIHPGEDLHDGATYERFLSEVDDHARACLLYDPSHLVLQCMDYVAYIDHYHERIRAFHVKDAEFRPNGRTGVYGGYLPWQDRAGRFRSTGDGDIDWTAVFSMMSKYGYDGWATIEWECCFKDAQQGAEEGSEFIRAHLITPPAKAFDDFAATDRDPAMLRRVLGLDE